MTASKERDDGTLLRLALENDQRAWREFVRRHDDMMREVAREATAAAGFDEARVDDVVGEAWLALLEGDMRRLRAYDPARGVPLAAWLALQATRAASKHLRQQGREPEFMSLDYAEGLPATPSPAAVVQRRARSRMPSPATPATRASVDAAIRDSVSAAVRDVVREEVRSVLREETRSHADRAGSSDTYLAIVDAAKLAEVHEATIRAWISRGDLPGYRAGRHRRVKRAELERFMASRSDGNDLDLDAKAAELAAAA